MSKELDYLDDKLNYGSLTPGTKTIIECIKKKLQRLEAIDNTNASEALECLKQIEDVIETKIGLGVVNTYLIDIIKQALQRLETIDNAKPSEAMKCLDKLAKQIELDEDTDFWEIRNAHKTVEQALLKAQEQEKMLDDNLVFENEHIMSGFDYKDKQIVAMPLDEYDKFIRQEKILQIIREKCLDNTNLDIIPSFEEYDTYYFYLKKYCVPQDMPIVREKKMLTEEEFYLLKKYFNGGKNENNS